MWTKRKKLILASLGSVLIHLVVMLVFAMLIAMAPASQAVRAPQSIHLEITHPEPTPTPVPLTLDNPPPPTPPPKRFVDSRDMAAIDHAPADTSAESDKDTAASSELPPTGTLNAPSQRGKVVPTFMFDTHVFAPAERVAEATAEPQTAPPLPTPSRKAAQPTSTPAPKPTPAPTPKADEFAMFDPTPTPAPPEFDPSIRSAQTEPEKPAPSPSARSARPARPAGSNFEEEKSQINGNIANRGPSSIAAMATPQGRYKKAVTDAIGSRWYAYINQRLDTASYGSVTIHFSIDRQGKVLAPHIIRNTGNEALASASMQAIMEARIPPIPDEVAVSIKTADMPLDFDFSLY